MREYNNSENKTELLQLVDRRSDGGRFRKRYTATESINVKTVDRNSCRHGATVDSAFC